ncbi:MAG: pyridoxal-phosphate dependent enzyme, partial [Anaerolinea sp.]|nr:pyridoxal-phosphate dependent enzyme [Anaerolinea sp.]
MSAYFIEVVCLECGAAQPPAVMAAGCPVCGSSWLDARYDYTAVAELWAGGALRPRPQTLWRYAELLPVDGPDPEITLGEHCTPLLRLYAYERRYDHPHIYVKDERHGPTSSFKDRQAALTVTALRQAGIRECVLASTGNAAAAYAAYCARAGIKLWLFLTSLVPAEKMREAALYGAEVVKVTGTYDETKQVAAEFARQRGLYFDRGARAIAGKESMKTLGFEIAEQLSLLLNTDGSGFCAPDWYIQAVSGG